MKVLAKLSAMRVILAPALFFHCVVGQASHTVRNFRQWTGQIELMWLDIGNDWRSWQLLRPRDTLGSTQRHRHLRFCFSVSKLHSDLSLTPSLHTV